MTTMQAIEKTVRKTSGSISLLDLKPPVADQTAEIIEGLTQTPRKISPKYFYDHKGSTLFDAITELEEYYLTRTEMGIMAKYAKDIADTIGQHKIIIEPGSGSAEKIRLLLPDLKPKCYVPIEISSDYMLTVAQNIREAFPELNMLCVKADYTHQLPTKRQLPEGEKVAFFPGSTIGNFTPDQAKAFLRSVKAMVDHSGGLLIGVDLKKSVPTIESAYNDKQGVTAEFNKNMLTHVNRLTGSNFEVSNWAHLAEYDHDEGCINMHLVSRQTQKVNLSNHSFEFAHNDTIHTESCYKFSLQDCERLFNGAGFSVVNYWTDVNGLFAIIYCQAR